MHYRLTITRIEKIEYTEEALAALRRERSYGINTDNAPKEMEVRAIECLMKEEEFDCIKQALLKVWK